MQKSAEQLKLEDFWMQVYIASYTRGHGLPPHEAADRAIQKFKDRFPPVFTPIQDKQPD